MLNVLFALLGLLAGGFISVLADDLPARVRPQRPHCPQCGHVHSPAGWLAIGRRLLQDGRCPQCALPTRRRALLVEVVTALLFAALPGLMAEPADLIFAALYIAILLLVIVIDLEHRLILHVVTFPATALALLGSLFVSGNNIRLALVGAVVGFIVFFFFYWLGQRLFGPGALGFGDVTLSMTLGAMVGFPAIVLALVVGVLLGGVITLLLLGAGRLTRRSTVAYGPFLAAAGIIIVVWGEQLLAWYLP